MIFARNRHVSHGEPPPVHAWHEPNEPGQEHRSACGLAAETADLDIVERLTGAPCTTCLLVAVGEQPADSAQDGHEPVVITVDPPTAPTPDGHHYGIALRGEHELHLITADAIRGHLDGREVSHTVCARLAFGPLPAAPSDWPVCDECTSAHA